MYYRIKIEELNNGKKLYIPQVSKLEIYGRWIKKQRLVWHNIHKSFGTTFGTSGETATKYSNEEDALKVIEGSLEQINKWADEGHTITFFTAREEKDRVVTLKWLWENGFKFHQLIMDKPRIKDNQEYVWVDNRKVRAVTYSGTWSDLVEVNAKIQTFN